MDKSATKLAVLFRELLSNVVWYELTAEAAFSRLDVNPASTRVIFTREIVPGDIPLLEGGNCVPADTRLFQSKNRHANESKKVGSRSCAFPPWRH